MLTPSGGFWVLPYSVPQSRGLKDDFSLRDLLGASAFRSDLPREMEFLIQTSVKKRRRVDFRMRPETKGPQGNLRRKEHSQNPRSIASLMGLAEKDYRSRRRG